MKEEAAPSSVVASGVTYTTRDAATRSLGEMAPGHAGFKPAEPFLGLPASHAVPPLRPPALGESGDALALPLGGCAPSAPVIHECKGDAGLDDVARENTLSSEGGDTGFAVINKSPRSE